MEKEIEYANNLRKQFLEICNTKSNQDEYYSVVMGIDFDSYDFTYYITQDIYIDVLKVIDTVEKGFLGIKRNVKKETMFKQKVGIYAIKNKNGLFEMTTGKKLSISGESNAIQCFGVLKISDYSLNGVAKDLKFLESNLLYKNQYINKLLSLSDGVYNTNRKYDEIRREKNSDIQYLKSYKLPNNYK